MIKVVQITNTSSDAQITDSYYVASAHAEHQKHVGGPFANPLYVGQLFDNCFVRQLFYACKV